MDINPVIFRHYDIRGIYPQELNEQISGAVARAFAQLLSERRIEGPIIVGRDVRLSSAPLCRACTETIQETGRDVIDIGVVTAPLLYFALGTTPEAAGGIMITASHNPAEYNGMKFLLRGIRQLSYENGISRLRELAADETVRHTAVSRGRLESRDYFPAYKTFLCSRAHARENLHVVVDAGGGAAGKFLPELLSCMNVRHTPLFFDADGTFSAHPPNPLLPEAQAILAKAVQKEKASFGVAFDADADRLAVADERGAAVPPDLLGLLLADALTKEGDEVIADVRVTHTIQRLMDTKQGSVYVSRVGTVYIKELMQKHNARFALELSGHYYFQEFFGADSAFLAFVHLLNIVSQSQRPLSELVERFRTTAQSGEKNFPVKDWEKLAHTIKKTYHDGAQSFIDGITVEYPDWWFNIRQSATEPLVRLNIEADTPEILEQKKAELTATINKDKIILDES